MVKTGYECKKIIHGIFQIWIILGVGVGSAFSRERHEIEVPGTGDAGEAKFGGASGNMVEK